MQMSQNEKINDVLNPSLHFDNDRNSSSSSSNEEETYLSGSKRTAVSLGNATNNFQYDLLLLLLITRPLPRDGGMAENHKAPGARKLPRA